MKKSIEPSSKRAERTREAILAAAEDLFARHGFASTRLEDVADTVHMTRAALFYYFRDKQFLFDAVLEYSFGALHGKLEKILAAKRGGTVERIEKAMEAWLDSITERPARARLILRLVADNTGTLSHGVFSDNNRVAARFWTLFAEGRKNGELNPLHADVFHLASAVVGTAVFYVAALSVLLPQGGFKPLAPEHAAAHKQEALMMMRLLLGIGSEAA